MSTSVKVLAAVAVVAIIALGVARLEMRPGGDSPTPSPKVEPEWAPPQADATEAKDTTVEVRPAYDEIVERDVFRPLVTAARDSSANERSGASGPPPGSERPSPEKPSEPKKPVDPLADLALTGVVQAGQDLQALIEDLSTRVGRYVRVGDEINGLRVAEIREDSVVLQKDDGQYTLHMGDKELPKAPSSGPSQEGADSEGGADSAQPTRTSSGPPGGMTIRGEFGNDMLRWAERTSLSQLERMYDRYSSYMSPEQRRQADEYLEDRRRREGR